MTEQELPPDPGPERIESEVARAIREAPDFGEIQGRCLAHARNVTYDPEIHNPHHKRRADFEGLVDPEGQRLLAEMIERFANRGTFRWQPRRPEWPDREGVRKVREL